jgi:hypothetical protein
MREWDAMNEEGIQLHKRGEGREGRGEGEARGGGGERGGDGGENDMHDIPYRRLCVCMCAGGLNYPF